MTRIGNPPVLSQSSSSSSDGWISAADTWTYASATTFTISGVDRTASFTPGTKIKLTQTTLKYFYVVSSTFSTNTTVTVTGGSDYSLANAAITLPNYSYQTNPQGFPTWFNYTTTYGGFSANPSGGQPKFMMVGKAVTVILNDSNAGVSNATSLTFTLPIAANAVNYYSGALPFDNGSYSTTPGRFQTNAASTTVNCYKDSAASNWTSSGNKLFNCVFTYDI